VFKIPRVNVIESEEGFSVEVLGRTGLLYTEQLRSMWIDSEVLATANIAVFTESIRRWNPPYEREPINEDQRDTIIDNIRRAFNWRGTNVLFEDRLHNNTKSDTVP
jgi:hypothetical protein